ncbi:Protease Do-like 9 isoform A [Chlorella sorokiniana]|uniref:Protease Do-like 9 isoform A n=1 Tax=Chlorella sorokiniana TaxID=3076 RepID=A0A2P6TRQ5_CHLSO|nr:Protease Do-like 9 isoform A [Chlorella sorokiniana]|eukprot:PRW56735.1 Protease Do-like 9 isoform A [Chlorella sorokiniana]
MAATAPMQLASARSSSCSGRSAAAAAAAGRRWAAPVECKKRQGGGGQHRAQQAAAKQREQQVLSGGGSGRAAASSSAPGANAAAPPPASSYALPPGSTLQNLDITKLQLELRGNEVVFTLKEPLPGDGTGAPGEEGEDGGMPRQEDVMDAVVKIYCTHTEPNYSLPWQRKRQYASTSSGFVVLGEQAGQRYLLTNAHSVEYFSQVKVKKRGDDRKWLAKVLAIGTECDIALLTVDDEEFWQGVQPLRFGPLPNLQESVYVVGYPIGGDTISVTSGVVSRIEVTAYAHGATELLGVQIDAAINSGNSGGPVFNELGEVVGIAFQSYAGSDAENIGYVIPTPVIAHFLEDYRANGTFTGFPALGVQWQRMESAALRQHFKMGEDQKGVLIRSVQPISFAHGHLLPGDVLMAFDGVEVACDGTVPFLSGERIAFSYLTSQKFTGEMATLDILRDGQPMRLEIKLMRPNALVQHHLNGREPSYLVVAGIVFTVVTEPYLESEYGQEYGREAPIKLLDKLVHGWKEQPDQEVVVVNQVLACNATLGYEEIFNVQVHKFNGQPVRNLRHLAELVLTCTEPQMRFDVEYSEVIVIDTAAAREATEEILRLHSIPAMASKDLSEVLAAGSSALVVSPTPLVAEAAAAAPAAPAAAAEQQEQEQQQAQQQEEQQQQPQAAEARPAAA